MFNELRLAAFTLEGHHRKPRDARGRRRAIIGPHEMETKVEGSCRASGAFLLAATGLLDGKRATTHWLAAEELARRDPKIHVDARVLYVDDGNNILTSAAQGSDPRASFRGSAHTLDQIVRYRIRNIAHSGQEDRVGYLLVEMAGLHLLELWTELGLVLSFVAHLAAIRAVTRTRRDASTIASCVVPLGVTVIIMVFRPTFGQLFS